MLLAASPRLFAQGSAFTYQGRLVDGGGPANGTYDLRFTLYDALTGGNAIAGPLTNGATTINNGLFTVTLDFGSAPFSDGSPRWMEIQVRTNGIGSFGTLSPRQALTATPYAITAGTLTGAVGPAGLSGTYASAVSFSNPSNQFTGNFNGNGLGLSNVNAATLGGSTSANFWQLGGNAAVPGQFLGTTNPQPLEFRVNNLPALQLVPTTNTANFIGGDSNNFVAPGVYGATIAGGGTLAYPGGVGLTNKVLAPFATIGGGLGNTASGNANLTNGDSATVGGGWQNSALGNNATVAGGVENTAMGDNSTVGGGYVNMSSGVYSTIAGGIGNTNAGTVSTTGGGYYNTNTGYISTIAGGGANVSSGVQSTVGGGAFNTSSGFDSIVGGGSGNIASAQGATVAGGLLNISSNFNATVPGGRGNIAGGIGSFAAGSGAQALNDGGFVWADATGGSFTSSANNQFLIRAAGGVGINTSNPVTDLHVNGTEVIQGGISATSTSSSNLLNLLVGGGSSPAATNGSLNGISFYEASAAKAMSLGYDGSGSSSLNALRIYGSTDTPLFSFLNGGSMGLGTTTPATALHVKASSDTQISLESSDLGGHRWSVQSSRVTGNPALDASFQIVDRTANSSRLLIGTNGNVGIGKTTPATTLDVNGVVTAVGFLGNGSSLTNVNASTLAGLPASNVWSLAGNNLATGQFLGSTNFQALELQVNSVRALRLEPTLNDAGHLNIINVIGGSRLNFVSNNVYGATIAGGGAENYFGSVLSNSVLANFGTVGGGSLNLSGGFATTIAGGYQNAANDSFCTIGGGRQNFATGALFGDGSATVAGGNLNNATGDYSTVGGGQQNNAPGYGSLVGGGISNNATNAEATVAGGFGNSAGGAVSTVAGGDHNTAAQHWGTVAGGQGNLAGGTASTVGGGTGNTATGNVQGYATIPGGRDNTAGGNYSFAAGYQAHALHDGAFVWADSIGSAFSSTGTNQFLIRAGGGVGIGTTTPEAPLHVAEGSAGTVTANPNSVAVFERSGSSYVSLLVPSVSETGFLFGNPDSSTDGGIIFNNSAVPGGLEFRTGTNQNRMAITASGNVGIGITAPTNKLHVIGGATFSSGVAGANQVVVWTPGSAAWSFTSDRNSKERFEPVDPTAVLEKVSRLPITEWNYKGYSQRHIGAMAQDFHAEFPLNESDTTLNDADLHGVTLAAIQGLNRKLLQSDTEIRSLREQNESLVQELEALKTSVAALAKAKGAEPTR